jgi:hypothetical protein
MFYSACQIGQVYPVCSTGPALLQVPVRLTAPLSVLLPASRPQDPGSCAPRLPKTTLLEESGGRATARAPPVELSRSLHPSITSFRSCASRGSS